MPSECQTIWIQIRPDILLGLIWVQTVCKGYQQMTLEGKELKASSIFKNLVLIVIFPGPTATEACVPKQKMTESLP